MHLLLIEDNPLDARAILRGLANWERAIDVVHETDADAALARLHDPSQPAPALVLLDLNLPGRNGHDVLDTIKADPRLRRIPVIVLTTSQAEEDILKTYGLGVSSFISKPVTFDGLVEVVQTIGKYWIQIVALPPSDADAA